MLLRLPAVMGEGFVGLGHAMRVFALLHGAAAIVRSVDELAREAIAHGALRPRTRIGDQPADREGDLTRLADFDRNLVRGAADAARAHFDGRLHVVERAL